MNLSTAVFLINDDVRAIKVNYNPSEPNKNHVFKTFDKSIKKDDMVVVPTGTRHDRTVVKVVEVDVDVDHDRPGDDMKWIVQKVDEADYDAVIKYEETLMETVRSADKKRRQDELRRDIFKDREGMLEGIPALQLPSGTPATPAVKTGD